MGGYEAVLFSGDVVGRGRGMVLLRVMVKASFFLIVIFLVILSTLGLQLGPFSAGSSFLYRL